MAGNSFGTLFRLTTFGESHGKGIGGIVDGCPAGLVIDIAFVQEQLDRRKPGQSSIVSQRKESDTIQFLSGIFEGKSTGAPIAFFIPNEDERTVDYNHLKDAFRPSHADYTYEAKYGHRDYRGGGRSSARETATRVAAGAIAQLLLKNAGVEIAAFVTSVGNISVGKNQDEFLEHFDINILRKQVEKNIIRCPDANTAQQMIELIEQIRKEGDTIGGVISCVITGVLPGLGEPVFDRLHADLGKAMLSINAVKGFEYGSGFSGSSMRGSEHNDIMTPGESTTHFNTNHSGGIQGGISNGEPIYFRVAFKPVATIMQEQNSVNNTGEAITIAGKGRHDPCVVPRAVPIVESMAALVIADHWLRNKAAKL